MTQTPLEAPTRPKTNSKLKIFVDPRSRREGKIRQVAHSATLHIMKKGKERQEEAEEEEEEEEEDAPLFICPECPKGYNELKRLNDHVKKYHPADPDSLICPSCDKHFSCTSSVTSHLSNGHCPVVPYLFFLVYQGLIFLSILFVR